jgi:hypothetical protein
MWTLLSASSASCCWGPACTFRPIRGPGGCGLWDLEVGLSCNLKATCATLPFGQLLDLKVGEKKMGASGSA